MNYYYKQINLLIKQFINNEINLKYFISEYNNFKKLNVISYNNLVKLIQYNKFQLFKILFIDYFNYMTTDFNQLDNLLYQADYDQLFEFTQFIIKYINIYNDIRQIMNLIKNNKFDNIYYLICNNIVGFENKSLVNQLLFTINFLLIDRKPSTSLIKNINNHIDLNLIEKQIHADQYLNKYNRFILKSN